MSFFRWVGRMEPDRSRLGFEDDLSTPSAGPDGNESMPDAAPTLWRQLAEAKTTEAFCQSWLALQCQMIRGVFGGVVVLGVPDRGTFAPVAFWPEGRRHVQHLAAAAERAVAERRGVVLKPTTQGSLGLSAQERYIIAYPIQVDGHVHGVVALDIAPRPEPKLAAVTRQLQWGSAWLELLFRRKKTTKDAAARDRLQTALDLLATVLEHERFYAAAMAFVTAIATRLECDRVSLGFIGGGRVRVRAVSHSAQFSKETNLIRAIESAMNESADQQAVIVYPAVPEGAARVVRAHAELTRQHGSGAICSIPLSANGRLLGVLTLERPVNHPFEPSAVELGEVVGAVAGPLLEVRRRDDRWLITKAAEAGRREIGRLIGPRYVGRKLAVAAAAALIVFFALAEGDYRVTAKTVVEAVIQRAVVAPFDGYIARAEVRAGDLVREGQVLAALDDRELSLERLRWLSQHDQLLKQHRQAIAVREAAQVEILAAQIDQAAAQLALLDQQLARTQTRAPFDGDRKSVV